MIFKQHIRRTANTATTQQRIQTPENNPNNQSNLHNNNTQDDFQKPYEHYNGQVVTLTEQQKKVKKKQ